MREKLIRVGFVGCLLYSASLSIGNAAPLFTGSSYDGYDVNSETNKAIPLALLDFLGTNGAVVADAEAASPAKGTAFGSWLTNTVATNWFAVTNAGTADLDITNAPLTGAGAAQFSIGGLPASVAAGAASNFWIAFAPTALGSQTAVVSIANSSTTTPYRVNLSGVGITPGRINLSAASLSYSAVYGSDPSLQVFAVTNGGQAAFGYTNILTYSPGAAGWLSVVAATGTVAGGASQTHTAQVSLAGMTPGTYTATSAVTSADAANSPQTLVVTLTLDKATPAIVWTTPAPIAYGTALSGTQLNANSTVPGTFVYTPSAGTVLALGTNQILQVVLNPDNGALYKTVTNQVMIAVNPTIVVQAGLYGTIVPGGTVVVPFGGATNFVVTVSDSRYRISNLVTNGLAVPAAEGLQTYTSQWNNITACGSISTLFDIPLRFSGSSYDGYDVNSMIDQMIDPTCGSVFSIR